MTEETQLDTLEARGLVRLATIEPEIEYLFRHWLVQDAAYESLLKQERLELHRLVGEAIEALYPDRTDEMAGILALHYEQAGDAAKAVDYLRREGRYALDRNAIREAFVAYDRAAALLPPAADDEPQEARRRRLEIGLGRARAGWSFQPVDEVVADLEGLLPDAEALADLERQAEIHMQLALVILESGRPATDPRAQRSLRRLAELGDTLDDAALSALPLALVGLNKVFLGPIREGVEALAHAIPRMEHRRDFIGAAFARGWLAIGYARLGEFEQAEAALRDAIEQARDGDLIAQLDAQISEAMVRSIRGDLEGALPLARACVARSEETGATACAVVSLWMLGDIYQRLERHDEAAAALEQGIGLAPVTGLDTTWRPTLLAWLQAARAFIGAPTDPAEIERALGEAREIGNRIGEAGMLWKRAEATVADGRPADALDDFAASAAIMESESARPELARIIRGWGEALRAAGRPDEGDEQLRRSLAMFGELGIEREAGEIRALLGPAPA